MTGERERIAPEMTPLVDPGSKTEPAEGGREEVDETPEPEPGWVPGPAGSHLVGRSRAGDPDLGADEVPRDDEAPDRAADRD